MGFAKRVNRRIRDLRETLLAVIPQRTLEGGHGSRRRIVAHAPDRFLSLLHQRLEQQAELIFAPAQSRHRRLRIGRPVQKRFVGGLDQHSRHRRDGADSLSNAQRVFGADKLAALGINQQNFSRPQALPFGDFFAVKIGNSHLGADDQQAIRGQGVTHRTQTIAVKLRADSAAVGEDQRCRTIPRFLHAGLLFEKIAQLGRGFG